MADNPIEERIKALRSTTAGLYDQVSDDALSDLLLKDPTHPELGTVDNQTQETRLKIFNAQLQAKTSVAQALSTALQGETTAVQLKAMTQFATTVISQEKAWTDYDAQIKAGKTATPPGFPRPNNVEISQSSEAITKLIQANASSREMFQALKDAGLDTNEKLTEALSKGEATKLLNSKFNVKDVQEFTSALSAMMQLQQQAANARHAEEIASGQGATQVVNAENYEELMKKDPKSLTFAEKTAITTYQNLVAQTETNTAQAQITQRSLAILKNFTTPDGNIDTSKVGGIAGSMMDATAKSIIPGLGGPGH